MTPDFVLSDEQRMLRESVHRWVDKHDPRRAEPLMPTWTHFAAMGWLSAGLPESVGGLGGDTRDTAIIAEELGRGLIRAPFVEVAVIAVQILLDLAPERVAAIALGNSRPVLAHYEGDTGEEPAWAGCRATRSGEHWHLTGHKIGILGADCADSLLVTATIEDAGLTLFELPAHAAPLTIFATVDDRAGGELHLEDTVATLIGAPGGAQESLRRALDYALVLSSAEAVGTMARALEITAEYLLSRRQFGQCLADFQALRHRLADMFIQVEQARSMVLRGVASLRDDKGTRALLATATKARVAQAALYVGAQAVQLHGGIGITDEYVIGHYYKRLVMFNQHHGAADAQVERFSRLSREGS